MAKSRKSRKSRKPTAGKRLIKSAKEAVEIAKARKWKDGEPGTLSDEEFEAIEGFVASPTYEEKIEGDPFEVIGEIPEGKAYQWVALRSVTADAFGTQIQAMERGGWTPVPSKRHPKMPDLFGEIVVQEQVLMERDAFHNEAAKLREWEKARKLLKESTPDETITRASPGDSDKWLDRLNNLDRLNKLKDGLLKTRKKESYVEMTIGVLVSDHEIEMANVTNLNVAEYMRRRVMIDCEWLVRADLEDIYGRVVENMEDRVPVFARGVVTIKREPLSTSRSEI